MRITESSATPAQAYNLTLAFQRTAGLGLREQITTEPTVKVLGSCFEWVSPNMSVHRVRAMLEEFDRLERGVFGGPTADTARGRWWDWETPQGAHPCRQADEGDCGGRFGTERFVEPGPEVDDLGNYPPTGRYTCERHMNEER